MASETTAYILRIDRHEVRLRYTAIGIRVDLERGTVIAEPGEPALPVRMLHVALPAGHKAHAISARVLSVEPLTRANARVVPVVEMEEDAEPPSRHPKPWYVPIDPAVRDRAFQRGRQRPAWLAGSSRLGDVPVATVVVQAVRFGPDRELELIRELEITVKHKATPAPTLCRPATFTLRQHALARRLVVNPSRVDEHPHPKQVDRGPVKPLPHPDDGRGPEYLPAQIDYLIVTDHRRWRPQGPVEQQISDVPPADPPGNLGTEFVRLADAKRARGLRAHIVDLSDVVAGVYGDFTTGALDVQEVLRNFLKATVDSRNTEYVLLGGDHSVIPPRLFCGNLKEPLEKRDLGQDTPPTDNNLPKGSYAWYSGGTMLMHIDTAKLSTYEGEERVLTMHFSGKRVPYITDAWGTDLLWFYCTDDAYDTASTSPTEYVRAEGLSDEDAEEIPHWYVRRKNLALGDLYYASLYGEAYDQPGKHDWNNLDNGLYGQFWMEDGELHDLGGGSLERHVRLGRAPVSNLAEAAAFVDKVLTYEASPTQSDTTRFNKMVIAAINVGDYDYMERKFEAYEADGEYVLAYQDYKEGLELHANEYVPDLWNKFAVLYATSSLTNNLSGELFAYPTDNAWERIPIDYDPDPTPGSNQATWHFAVSYSDLSVSESPTSWVVVHSDDPAILAPRSFGFDVSNELDTAIERSDELYVKMKTNFPHLTGISRLYTDDTDVQNDPNTVLRLSDATLLGKLEAGPNLIAVAGHGGRFGVSNLLYSKSKSEVIVDKFPKVQQLANSGKPFVAFVRSCLTGSFDFDDCLGEDLVTEPSGGAVAYVGFGTITSPDHNWKLQHAFFELLAEFHRIGEIFDNLHHCVALNASLRVHLYGINLLGDPEMVIWRDETDLQSYYIGNRHTKELHERFCPWADRIWVGHEIKFDSLNDGLELGYDGCYYCMPEYHTR